jgi:Kef-type K+ transport system membrane component KefB
MRVPDDSIGIGSFAQSADEGKRPRRASLDNGLPLGGNSAVDNVAEAPAATASAARLRLAVGYLLLGLFLAGAVSASLVLGSRRTPAPAFAGSYTSRASCFGGPTNVLDVAQSGVFVDLSGAASGKFRIHGGRIAGTVRCQDRQSLPISLRRSDSTAGLSGVIGAAPVTLVPELASQVPAAKPRGAEDTVGRLLLAMAAIIIAARVLGSAVVRIGQPRVMGEVLAGILLGPTLFGLIWPTAQHYFFPTDITPLLNAIAQVGLVFYLFLVGMEFDPTLLRGRVTQAAFISNASVALPFGLGMLAAVPLYTLLAPSSIHFSAFAVFVGVAMSITAFPVLARILGERRMLGRPVGALCLATAAIDDVTAWGLLALALAVSGSGSGLNALTVIGWTALLVVGMVLLARPFLGRAAAAYAEVGQLPIIWTGTIFVSVLLAAFASERAGVAPIFGAFVMGSVMPRNAGLTTDVSRRFDDFVTIILLPLFFAITGLKVDVTGLDNGLLWLLTLGILAIAVLGKWGGGQIAARYVGFSRRDSAVIGALMNTRGLTELIVLNIALTAGAISPKLFSMLVLMALVTTFMAGPALRLLDPKHELSSSVEEEIEPRDDASVGLHTIVVAAQDDRNVGALLAIAEPLARSQPPRELVVIEALRSETLVAGRLRDMDEVTRVNRRLDDQRRILARNGVTARVAAFLSTDPVRDYLRMVSHEPVDLILIDGRRPWLGPGVPSGPVGRVLDQAPCDVAVLVERAERPLLDAAHPVVVPFGGADHDWSALEIGCMIASARRTGLRLVGSAGTSEEHDASRLLEQASLVVKGFTGIEAEQVLMEPGEAIVAASADAGLFVVGLAENWRDQGLGTVRAMIARTATTAVLFVRRGRRASVLGSSDLDLTRVRWSSVGAPDDSPGESG